MAQLGIEWRQPMPLEIWRAQNVAFCTAASSASHTTRPDHVYFGHVEGSTDTGARDVLRHEGVSTRRGSEEKPDICTSQASTDPPGTQRPAINMARYPRGWCPVQISSADVLHEVFSHVSTVFSSHGERRSRSATPVMGGRLWIVGGWFNMVAD